MPVMAVSDFPLAMVEELGYQAVFHGQKTHYGVAILSRQKPVEVYRGFPHDDGDAQRRLITATFPLAEGRKRAKQSDYVSQDEIETMWRRKWDGKQRSENS